VSTGSVWSRRVWTRRSRSLTALDSVDITPPSTRRAEFGPAHSPGRSRTYPHAGWGSTLHRRGVRTVHSRHMVTA
jgi:hypothetical protein